MVSCRAHKEASVTTNLQDLVVKLDDLRNQAGRFIRSVMTHDTQGSEPLSRVIEATALRAHPLRHALQ